MKMYSKLFLFLIIVAIFAIAQPIQSANKIHFKEAGAALVDTAPVHIRKPSTAKLKKFRNDPGFDYDNNKPPDTIVDRFMRWVNSKLNQFFSTTYTQKAVRYTIRILLYAGIIFSVIFILMKLLKSDIRGLFMRTSENIADDQMLLHDLNHNIHTIDLDELIKEYIAKKEYRLVVRLYYAQMLKTLSVKGLISWKIEKTNRDYLAEINDIKLKDRFHYITRLFEYVWYGNLAVDIELFVEIQKHFTQLDNMLGSHEKIY